ncbi:MAG TPA: hypothetical protein VL992_03925 [Tepidisphaeraceae bacterium]|nr:hypothetical protein [Tepidisphaeraceae bacterium]
MDISILTEFGTKAYDLADLPPDLMKELGIPVDDPLARLLPPGMLAPSIKPAPLSCIDADGFLDREALTLMWRKAVAQKRRWSAIIGQGLAANQLAAPEGSMQGPMASGQATLPSTQERWEALALQRAGINEKQWDPSQGYEGQQSLIAHEVYQFYQHIYQQDPNLQWAGLAYLAGGAVLNALNNLAQKASRIDDALFSGPIAFTDSPGAQGTMGAELSAIGEAQSIILEMQKAVFDDLAWQHEAYLDGGFAAIEQAYLNGSLPADAYAAWKQVDNGIQTNNSAEILAGNTALLYREQNRILQPYYNKINLPVLNGLVTATATNPMPGGAQFSGTDIADFAQRWDFILKQVVQPWAQMTPAQRTGYVNQNFKQLTQYNHDQPDGQ